jgi:hypothetical protein
MSNSSKLSPSAQRVWDETEQVRLRRAETARNQREDMPNEDPERAALHRALDVLLARRKAQRAGKAQDAPQPRRNPEPEQGDDDLSNIPEPGDEWIEPVERGYLAICCDCDLCHRVDFRVVNGRAQFRVRLDEVATEKLRAKESQKSAESEPTEDK